MEFILAFLISTAYANDLNGQYKDSPLHAWFDSLASKRGLCCSFADGRMVDDPDIDASGDHYRVRIDGAWLDVPNEAVVNTANKFGHPVVWPYKDANGNMQIRCFLPGAMI